VADVLARTCLSCHAAPPRRGAKSTLLSRADLAGPWENAASLAHLSLERMRDALRPMPPDAPTATTEADIAILAAWIEGGMKEGSCATAPPIPAPATPVCTSGRFWNDDDDEGSPLMTPGRACIQCHDLENIKKAKDDDDDDDDDDELEAPAFTAAGTLYPTLLEPDDCFGVGTQDAQIILTGADGRTQSLPVNRAGNFYTELPLALPYRAEVVRNGKRRVMTTAQTSGDCNLCHAVTGEDAPGRILSP